MTRQQLRFLSLVAALLVPFSATWSQRPLPPREPREADRGSGGLGEIKEDIEGREGGCWQQRTYPFAEPLSTRMAELYIVLRMRPSLFSASAAAAPLTGSWRPIGPNGLWVAPLAQGPTGAT